MFPYSVRAVGIAWYRREDYERIRAIMDDRDKLPATFDEWLQAAEELERNLERAGHIVERVYIDPDAFAEWCRLRRLDIDSQARMRFSNEVVARKYLYRS